MNYELAKQLKDAGFPQEFSDEYRVDICHEFYCTEPDFPGQVPLWITSKEYRTRDLSAKTPILWEILCKKPTLSELIEACGESFQDLEQVKERDDYKWEASADYTCCDEHGEGRKYEGGSTPEEAVARLWLELNKK